MKTKLRLGPLPKAQQIKITITVTAELKELLDRYAELHAQSTGEKNDVTRLVPFMLQAFISNDRAFRSASNKRTIKQSTTST